MKSNVSCFCWGDLQCRSSRFFEKHYYLPPEGYKALTVASYIVYSAINMKHTFHLTSMQPESLGLFPCLTHLYHRTGLCIYHVLWHFPARLVIIVAIWLVGLFWLWSDRCLLYVDDWGFILWVKACMAKSQIVTQSRTTNQVTLAGWLQLQNF